MSRTPISAKPLFRAISGAKRRQAPQPTLMDLPEHTRERDTRREHDFYPTGQPEAIRALMSAEWPRLAHMGTVWEPAVGDGALAREIAATGLAVIGSDIVDRGWPLTDLRSFYDFKESPAPAIITNPPYSEINARDGHGRWLRHTLEMSGWEYCALLLSWDWPAARANGLGALLDRHPFSWCYLLRWKLDFTGAGSPPQRNAWFVWDRDDPRDTKVRHPDFRWLDRTQDMRQGSML